MWLKRLNPAAKASLSEDLQGRAEAEDLITSLRGPVTSLLFITAACNRWIDRDEPDLAEIRSLLDMLDNCGKSLLEIIPAQES